MKEELRTCIIRVDEEVEESRTIRGERITRIIHEAEEHKGFFHRWHEKFWTIGASPLIGGFSDGQMSQMVGIVEYEDGSVHEHLPSEIHFTDRSMDD